VGAQENESAQPLLNPQLLPIAPLLQLEPQYPLQLSKANRERLYGPSALALEAEKNQHLFKRRTLPWALLLSVSTLGLLLWGSVKFYRRKQAAFQPQATPRERALKALESVTINEDMKSRYSHLKNTILSFLEESSQLPLKPLTPSELSLKEEIRPLAIELLKRSDQILYSNQEPQPSEWPEDLEKTRQLISTWEASENKIS
jgi:hypothetical protein